MKQVVQSYRTGELTVADVPPPATLPGGVIVSVAASLVSVGTERIMVDLARSSLLAKARKRPDQVRRLIDKVKVDGILNTYRIAMNRLDGLSPLGYSCAGVVKHVGEGLNDLHRGDWVACGGAGYANHAEIVFVPRNLVVRLPSASEGKEQLPAHEPSAAAGVCLEDAAFTTVGAIALQGVRQAAPALGETVAVVGLGLIGQLVVQLLKANGCRVLGMDVKRERCQLAERMGADATARTHGVFASLVSARTKGRGADAVVIAASTRSNAPLKLSAQISRDRGRVVALGSIGLDVPRQLFYRKELDLRLSRSYGPGRYDAAYEKHGQDYPIGYVRWTENRNMQAFLDLLIQGRLDVRPLITHRFPIEEATKAYDLITDDRSGDALGVILTYGESRQRACPVVWLNSGREIHRTHASPRQRARVRLGLIGCGRFAQDVLLPALARVNRAELRAVCSASGISARHAADKYGATYCTADAERVTEDENINAVLIATRHGSHARFVVQALKAGKCVFVEKPLALTELQLREIGKALQLQRATGKAVLMVGFNRRFAPLSLVMRAFLADAVPLMVHYRVNAGRVSRDSWVHDPVEGGGRIVGEICHFVDFLQFLTKARPVRVQAFGVRALGEEVPADNLAIQITLGDGSVGSILYAASGDQAFPKERVEAFGGGRVAVLENYRKLVMVKNGRRRVRRTGLRRDKGHTGELVAFADAVCQGAQSPITFESLVRTSLTTFRIRDSLRTGEPRRVTWQDDLSLDPITYVD